MTARYFAVSSLAGCFRTSTAVAESTTASRFDSTYVANAILVGGAADYASIQQPFLDSSTSVSSLWFRADIYNASVASGQLLTMLNAGTNAYRINNGGSSSSYQFQYWNGSAWTNWGSTFTITAGTLQTLVVHLICGTSFEIFLGGTSIVTGSSPTSAQAAVTEVRLQAPNGTAYWSQVMGADYDIRDAHLMPATFNGNSATNTGGTGAYTDINETALDESTAEIVATVGNKMGQTHAAITVPTGLGIAAVVLNARGRVSGGTVADGKLGVRSGSTNSSSAGRAYNGGYEPRGAIWTADPNGGGAWTQSTFNSAETYVEAA
jgi:hypothetical protein